MLMKKIKIIHWDDDPDEKINVGVRIKRYFGKDNVEYLFYNCNIDEFEKMITNENQVMIFDLLIQDLLDKNGNVVGTRILKQLPKETKVIVLTQSGNPKVQKELNDPLIIVDYQKLYKSDVLTNELSLVSAIENKTCLKRIQNIPFVLEWDRNDPIADYPVSVVTKDHLENLIFEYLNNNNKGKYPTFKKEVRINPLVSGQSGALVFQVEFFFEPNGRIPILLKVDQIKSNIEKELGSADGYKYKQIHQNYRLEYDKNILESKIQSICWYALTANFIEKGETLKRKILEAKDYNEIEVLLISLFGNCLKSTYSSNINELPDSTIIYPLADLMNILTPKKKAFILNAIKELFLLSDKINESYEINDSKVKNIFNFQSEKKVLNSQEKAGYNKIVLVHGDMHGNNIMVSDGQIKIIDPANMGHDYWTRDLCMLIVDLFAYGIDYNDRQYFGIERIKDWRDIGKLLFEGKGVGNVNNNKVVCQALSNLSNWDYIKEKLGFEIWFESWEFQLSLVIEFLRISYKSNQLPAGKRAACMLIAIDGFEKAKKSYEIFVKRQNK